MRSPGTSAAVAVRALLDDVLLPVLPEEATRYGARVPATSRAHRTPCTTRAVHHTRRAPHAPCTTHKTQH
eukprot:4686005-Prymnesium_polylepis.1